MTRNPKNARRDSRTTVTIVPMPALSGVPTAHPISPPDPGTPAWGTAGVPRTCAMPRTEAIVHSQPIASRPRASGRGPRRSRRSAAKNRTTGSTMTSEPMTQRTPSARPTPTGPIPLLQAAAPNTIARPRTARPTPSLRCSGASGSPSSGRATDRAIPPAPRASRFQLPATTPQRPGELFFLAAGRRPAVEERLAGGRFLLAAVEPERARVLEEVPAGRRDDVVRAGMCRTVIAFGAPVGQVEPRVPQQLTRP